MDRLVRFLRENPPVLAVVLFVIYSLFANVFVAMRQVCDESGFENKIGKVEIGCFDFWLNRYQTLFGVIVAVAAAWVAWRGAQRQVAASNRQRSVSLINILNDRLDAAEAIGKAVTAIDRLNNQMRGNLNGITEAAKNIRACGSDESRKEMIFKRDFEQIGKNYITLGNAFEKRIEIVRENIKPAILTLEEKKSVEQYLKLARNVERKGRIIRNTISEGLEPKGWAAFDSVAFKIEVRSNADIHGVKFRGHPAQHNIRYVQDQLSKALDLALRDAHR